MKRFDPRLQRAEKLLQQVVQLLQEIRSGAPPARRKRRSRFTPAKILASLREGARFDAPRSERDPRLPCRATLKRWRHKNPKLDEQVAAIFKERARASSQRKGRGVPTPGATVRAERMPGKKHDWDAILAKIEGGASIGPATINRQGLPSHTLIMARRKADPAFGQRVAAALSGRFGLGRRLWIDKDAVLDLIRGGAVIKASPPHPGMPWKRHIDRARREDPAFDAAVLQAIAEARRRRSNRLRLSKLPSRAAWFAARDAVPSSISPDLRDDIVGELSLMIVSGEVALDGDLQTAWKRCRTRVNGHRWKESSLDAVVAGTDGLRRIDLLRDDVERL